MTSQDLFIKSLGALLSHWRADPLIGNSIVTWETTPAQPALSVTIPSDLHPSLGRALEHQGIGSLYSHQNSAWREIRAGNHIIIVTGTASGKTYCYNLPVIDRLLRDPNARALYLFPTKALAHDQLGNLTNLLHLASGGSPSQDGYSIQAGVYDGDTPSAARQNIRARARILLSNPDMLHTGILPHHTIWADLFRNLAYVVIDEVHTYRGVFGSHVANVLRRLRRIAKFYGSSPQFILTSATVANPAELAERLVEAPVSLIDEDGSARGSRHFLIYNPPVVDKDLGLRRSSLLESVRLGTDLVRAGVQTILFGRSRRSVELVLSYLRQYLPESASRIRGYRSGYLPRERRAIEQGLRQRDLDAVVATNALELGIDIGGMGAAVLVGYPGTIAATRQQAGRAGRTLDTALAVLVTSADPIDQFLAHHPEYLFGRSPEHALINPDNLLILLQHLRCAAFELPFKSGEPYGRLPIELLSDFLRVLEESGVLHFRGDRYFWMADQYPANEVSLRSASSESILLRTLVNDQPTTIGDIDIPSAPWLVHPGAVYLHEGQSYLVEDLDLDQKFASLRPVELDYYTEPQSETTVQQVSVSAQEAARGCQKTFGEIIVTSRLTGFRKIRWYTHEVLGNGAASLPPTSLNTTGYWLTIQPETVSRLAEQGLWTNTPNDYGPDWPRLRDKVRARDGYRCQMCGALEVGRSHHVHHVKPFRTFHSLEQANRLENLTTLCPNCHRKAEVNVRMRSGLARALASSGVAGRRFMGSILSIDYSKSMGYGP